MTFVKQPDGSYMEAGVIGDIGAKVVDDTRDFGVPVSGVPPPNCPDFTIESMCTAAGCYWYDGTCHSEPKVPPDGEIPWVTIAAVGGAIIAVVVAVFLARR